MHLVSFAIGTSALLLSASPMAAQTPCVARHPATCFARDAIRSLVAAHRGAVRPDTTGTNGNVVAIAQAIVYAARQQEAALGDAQQIVAPYTTVSDSAIREPAVLLDVSYRVLADFQATAVASLREQLDGQGGGPGSAAVKLADLQLQRRQAAEGLIAAAGGVAQALIAPADAAGHHRRLVLTSAERRELLLAMSDGFGAATTPKNGQYGSDYAAAAAALRAFLTDPGWRVAAMTTERRPGSIR